MGLYGNLAVCRGSPWTGPQSSPCTQSVVWVCGLGISVLRLPATLTYKVLTVYSVSTNTKCMQSSHILFTYSFKCIIYNHELSASESICVVQLLANRGQLIYYAHENFSGHNFLFNLLLPCLIQSDGCLKMFQLYKYVY